MAAVYLAEMVEDRALAAAGSRVALKLLHEGVIADAAAAQRFQRETRLGSTIRHRGVVRTHEAGTALVDGVLRHFLVMELAEGRTLRALLDEEGPLPEPRLRDVGRQIAEALAAIHAAGAVHGDVKPSNVIIDASGVARLMDLGVARLHGAPTLTGAGVFLGSLAYASPEQLGRAVVGPSSDLYSLGLLLYEAAAGRRPLETDDVADLVRLRLEGTAPRLGDLVGDVTPLLDEIIACLLEAYPARRFSSSADLAAALGEGEASAWWADRVRALQAPIGRALPRIPVRRDTSLVGRSVELESLASILSDVMDARGALVLIEGEAGVGKSRLLAEMLEAIPADVHVLYASFPPGGAGEARSVLAEALVEHVGAPLEEGVARLLDSSPLAPAFAAHLRGDAPPPGAEPLTRVGVHALFRRIAHALASERATIFVVEDLHFAGADDRALLAALAAELGGLRLMLVLSFRPGIPPEHLAGLERSEAVRRIALRRLDRAAVIDLLGEAVASRSLAEELDRRLGAKPDGNPFFVLEMLRDLERRRVLRPGEDGRLALVAGSGAIEVPSSVRALVLERLGALAQGEREIVDAAAVQGHVFDPDLVARVLGLERVDVLHALAGIERRTGIVRGDEAGWRFDHHQLQEITYAALPDTARAQHHARLASEYERREGLAPVAAPDVPGHSAAFIVHHYLRGARRSEAARLLMRALSTLEREFRFEALLELASEARSVMGDADPALSVEIMLKQDESHYRLARRAEQRATCADLQVAAAASGDPILITRAASTQGRLHLMVGEYREALEIYRRALASSLAAGFARGEANARQGLGTAYRELALRELAVEEHRRALVLWRSLGDVQNTASELGNLGSALAELGAYTEARKLLEEALRTYESLRASNHLAICHVNLGWLHYCVGEWRLAREHWGVSVETARERGYPTIGALAKANLCEVDIAEGRLESAHAHAVEARETSHRMGDRRSEAFSLHRLGEIARARGQEVVAEAFYEEALALRRSVGLEGVCETTLALGRLEIESGAPEAARKWIEEAAELGRTHAIADVGWLPDAYLALLGARDPRSVLVHDRCPVHVRAEAHFVLHLAGGGAEHVEVARSLLERASSHLVGEDLDAFWRWNPVARAVREVR
jgi:tetratricopeptide (TPR) repeat protein/tRNA A-37 threonylcarbamoyl transferase component Bud32